MKYTGLGLGSGSRGEYSGYIESLHFTFQGYWFRSASEVSICNHGNDRKGLNCVSMTL